MHASGRPKEPEDKQSLRDLYICAALNLFLTQTELAAHHGSLIAWDEECDLCSSHLTAKLHKCRGDPYGPRLENM